MDPLDVSGLVGKSANAKSALEIAVDAKKIVKANKS